MNNYRNHVDEYMYPTNYSWMDDTYHTAMITDHYMSISGGNKSLKIFYFCRLSLPKWYRKR